MDGGAGMALDEQMIHVVPGEQDGSGQADQAPADDEHGDVTLRHGLAPSACR